MITENRKVYESIIEIEFQVAMMGLILFGIPSVIIAIVLLRLVRSKLQYKNNKNEHPQV